MAKNTKTLRSNNENGYDFTYKEVNKAVIRFNDAVLIEMEYNTATKKLSAKCINKKSTPEEVLSGEVTLS